MAKKVKSTGLPINIGDLPTFGFEIPKNLQNVSIPTFDLTSDFENSPRQKGGDPINGNIQQTKGVNFNILGTYKNNIQLSSGWVDKKSFEKGKKTIIGMAPRITSDRRGGFNLTQGFNYANPKFTATNPTSTVPRTPITERIAQAKQMQYLPTVNLKNPTSAISFGTALKMVTTGKTREEIEQASASSNARLSKISIAKASSEAQFWNSGGGSDVLGQANSIRSQLGQKPIEVQTIRRRRGRYTTRLTGDPVGELQAYYNKKGLADWAKGYGLEIDPNLETTIQTGIDYKTVSYSRVIHNGRVVYGSYIKETPITKKVKFSEAPEAVKTNMLYNKLVTESSAKKARYLDLYDPIDTDLKKELDSVTSQLSAVESSIARRPRNKLGYGSPPRAYLEENAKRDELAQKQKDLQQQIEFAQFNYFSIPEEELSGAEKYKSDLVQGIGELNQAQYDMKDYLARSPFVDAPSKVDDDSPKMRYLAYQKDPTSELGRQAKAELDPIINSLQSKINNTTPEENINLQGAINFVSGKIKDFKVDNTIVATRDNLGRVAIKDQDVFGRYVQNLPSVYYKPAEEDYTKQKIAGLESEYDKEIEEYQQGESEVSYRQRAEAELGNVSSPRRLPSYFTRLQRSAGRRR